MIFNLTTTGYFYPSEKDRIRLGKLGFIFHPCDFKDFHKDNDQELSVELNTLEELIAFSKKHGAIIVDDESIEIYDGYRE